MTRIFMLIVILCGLSAEAQTYIRPSKGTTINPWSSLATANASNPSAFYTPAATVNQWATWPYLTNPGSSDIDVFGGPWDWSAFEAMRIRVYGTAVAADGGVATNAVGGDCALLSTQYTVSDIGSYALVHLIKKSGGTSMKLYVYDSASPTGPWHIVSTANSTYKPTEYVGCPLQVRITPLPFAAPAATANVTVTLPDGGITVNVSSSSTVNTAPYTCGTTSVHTSYQMDGGSQVIGQLLSTLTDGGQGVPTSLYVVVCNSKDNSGTANVRCRDDAVSPILDAGAPGTVLGVGDCVPFTSNTNVTTPLSCIGTSNWVSAYECAP